MPPTRFVVESQGQKGVIYTEVGNFEEVVCDDDSVKNCLIINKREIETNSKTIIE